MKRPSIGTVLLGMYLFGLVLAIVLDARMA